MLTIGLIGHGRWGSNIQRTLETFPDVVVSIIEKDAPLGEFDGVCIATPSSTHAAVALPYIEKGIPTFIEKPLAISYDDARAIRDAAEAHATFVQVGHIHTHNPAFLEVCALVPRIGTLRMASFEHLYALPRTDSSVFWDCLPHSLSMALMLFKGKPQSVKAWSLTKTATGLTETGMAAFSFDGIPVCSELSWQSPVKRTSVTLIGTEGTIFLDDGAKDRKIALHRGETTYPPYDATSPLTRELAGFVEAIRNREHTHPSLAIGSAIVKMIEAAEESARSGNSCSITYEASAQ